MADLRKYYNHVEEDKSFDYGSDISKLIDRSEWDELTEKDYLMIQIESNIKNTLESYRVNFLFSKNRNEVIQYLISRNSQTNNSLLKARYSHFLYVLTKDNRYAKMAIDNYHIIIKLYYDNTAENNYISYYSRTLEQIISLVEKTKHKTLETKALIIEHLDGKCAIAQIQTAILKLLKKCKLFKTTELTFVPRLCLCLANSEKGYYKIKNILETGLFFAVKDAASNKSIIPHIYELLGDNEISQLKDYNGKTESMMIPHNNQDTYKNMMEYYKKAKNQTKLNNATKLYNDNKKNLRLIKISNQIATNSQIPHLLDDLFQSIISAPTIKIVFDLCLGKNLLFPPHDRIEESIADNANSDLYKYFPPVHIDNNGNQKRVEVEDHLRFVMFDTWLRNYIQFTYDIILSCINSKKLSYTEVKRVLLQSTFFGHELIVSRVNEQEISYTFFDQIDIALKSFFQECKYLINSKRCDWRISIDILSLNFEGILRDIIGLQSGVNTKIDKDGNTVEMLLDDLLRSDGFKDIFDKDDENLFYYTFTNKGLNIRNNVAHGFYKPQDYTFFKAVLVLLCVLRLAKFVPENDQEVN